MRRLTRNGEETFYQDIAGYSKWANVTQPALDRRSRSNPAQPVGIKGPQHRAKPGIYLGGGASLCPVTALLAGTGPSVKLSNCQISARLRPPVKRLSNYEHAYETLSGPYPQQTMAHVTLPCLVARIGWPFVNH